jgi:hypothetical protein
MQEVGTIKKTWTIRKYASDQDYLEGKEPFEVSSFEGNVLLNEGINNVLLALLCGTDSPNPYSNTYAYIGVGDDDGDVAADADQTGLQGSNTSYASMESGYPSVSSQKATWRAVFDGSTGNHAWQEFTVVNASDDTGDNLNRKVSDQGTKASGQTWTLDIEIVFS